MSNRKIVTKGFGVPVKGRPHQFLIDIPKGRKEFVEILEDFGVVPTRSGRSPISRVVIPRQNWGVIAADIQRYLNRRLKEKKLKTSRFITGENCVDRILGRELCVLAWSIEKACVEETLVAFSRWLNFRPEELWWLYFQIVKDGGKRNDKIIGWRLAIKNALLTRSEDEAIDIDQMEAQNECSPQPYLLEIS